jgi:iron-sulfur cluster assembly accessory protein
MTSVLLTERAAKRIADIISGETAGTMLRVSVNAGGCTGFQYSFDLVSERDDSDYVIEKQGVAVLIDEVSLPFMQGAEIDFVDDLIGASFQVKNPNATQTCGCGVSFTI